MSVVQGLQNLFAFARIKQTNPVQQQQSVATISPEAKSDFLRARTELLNLYRDIERLGVVPANLAAQRIMFHIPDL